METGGVQTVKMEGGFQMIICYNCGKQILDEEPCGYIEKGVCLCGRCLVEYVGVER